MSYHSYLTNLRNTPPAWVGSQHFGLGVTTNELLAATLLPIVNNDYYRQWAYRNPAMRDFGSHIKADIDKFMIVLDVQQFAPEDINVKVVDGYIVVEGRHEEKKDEHGFISRQFVRRYALPEGIQPEVVESKLSSDGLLTVDAPMKDPEAIKGERKVPIVLTGAIHKKIKDQSEGTHENSK